MSDANKPAWPPHLERRMRKRVPQKSTATPIASDADFDAHMARLRAREDELDNTAIVFDPGQVVSPGNVDDLQMTLIQKDESRPALPGAIDTSAFLKKHGATEYLGSGLYGREKAVEVDWNKWEPSWLKRAYWFCRDVVVFGGVAVFCLGAALVEKFRRRK